MNSNSFHDLKTAFEKLKSSLNVANIGLAHIAFNGEILWANKYCLDLIGYTEADIGTLNVFDFTPAELIEKKKTAIEKLRSGELDTYALDQAYVMKDGTQTWVHMTSKVYRDEIGAPQYIVSAHHNINQRKEFENLLNMVMTTIPSLVSYLDKDLKYKFVNKSYEKWFGIPYQEIIGKSIIEVIGSQAFDQASTHINRALKGEYVEFERQADYKLGGSRIVKVTYIPDIDSVGRVLGIVAVVTDVSEVKYAKLQNEELQKQINFSAKQSVLGALSSAVSHQLALPLEALNSKIEQLEAHLKQMDIKSSLAMSDELSSMKLSCHQISKVIIGLKAFSPKEGHDKNVAHNLALIIEDAVSFCKDRMLKSKIIFSAEDASQISINCRGNDIAQVIAMLLDNSCDAVESLEEKWIKVKVKNEPNRTILSVIDSGRGLDLNIAKKLSSPFFTTKKMGTPSGISLNHSRSIIEEHGGKLYYDSSISNTCFTIELPRNKNYGILNVE